MKKNLIFFTETTAIGGAEVYLQILALDLNKDQFNVRIALPNNKNTRDFAGELRSKGVQVDYIGKYNLLGNYFYFRRTKPDCIHFNIPMPVINCCTVAMLAGLAYSKSRLYATVHMIFPEYKPNMIIRTIMNLIYRKLDLIVTVSEKNKDVLVENFKLPVDQIKVIYNCVDIAYIKNFSKDIVISLRKKFSIKDSTLVFGTVARLDEQKGHEYLIEASRRVIVEVPDSIFLFVGKGKLKDRLISMIKEKSSPENFRMVGYQENLPEIFALIDIFILPSISEGLPFSVLEAMAAKKPVIATSVGGTPEIITNDVDGILVESRDADALAKAMLVLSKNKKKRDSLACTGERKILEVFSLERMISNTKEIYN